MSDPEHPTEINGPAGEEQKQVDRITTHLRSALADHYAIEREVGSGGMAHVFLAHDLKHDRQVAVKILRPELSASLGAERFLREIKIAAKLHHPHILPLYDSGAAEDFLYYVMPFVEGESLRDLLKREKQLPLEEAVRITREVAGALAQAHSYGIVHRDIKPENVMMSGGHAVVTDFGIARAFSAAGGEVITQTGMAVGTPAYMSPEQAAGDPDIDGRTDIYSLGCMLYEMLVGQIPFTGPNAVAIIARHTMDAVTPPSIMRQSIPAELEDVILKAMEKAPADRFRAAGEMVQALDAVGTGTATLRRATRATGMRAASAKRGSRWIGVGLAAAVLVTLGVIGSQVFLRGESSGVALGGRDPRDVAVLYFEDLSRDKSLEPVADGVTEGLIDKLAQASVLSVVSANGVAPFRGATVASDSIARALDVGSLVRGSVERVGGLIKIDAALDDAESGSNIDRTSVELPEEQLFLAQDSIADAVSRFLRQRIGEEVRLRERRARASNVNSWLMLQRAERLRKDAREASRGGNAQAAAVSLERADSELALAEQSDADWYEPLLLRGWVDADRAALERQEAQVPFIEAGLALAERVLGKATTGTHSYAEALELRGALRYRLFLLEVTPDRREWEDLLYHARDDLEAAVEIDPSLVEAQLVLSQLRYHQLIDDVPGALAAARAAYERDAYLENSNLLLDRMFWTSLDLEAFSEARRWCAEGTRRFPDDFRFTRCRLWLMVSPAVTNPDVSEAARLLARMYFVAPENRADYLQIDAQMVFGGVLGKAGLRDSALRVLTRASARVTPELDDEDRFLGIEAIMRSLAGDVDGGIDLLKRYVAAHPDHHFVESQGTVFWYRELRASPRWREVAALGN